MSNLLTCKHWKIMNSLLNKYSIKYYSIASIIRNKYQNVLKKCYSEKFS